MDISYLVTTKNEVESLSKLLDRLLSYCEPEDEIIILDDFSDNVETVSILEKYSQNSNKIKIFKDSLNNDYGKHKNNGIEKCTKSWIFQIDADELPQENLLLNIKNIIESNLDVELIFLPRINNYTGVTQNIAVNWGWRLSPSPYYEGKLIVQWPDYQGRCFLRNYPRIHWEGKLHERIIGHKSYVFLPEDEDLALLHCKTIERQIETNLRYNKNFSQSENMGHKVR